MTPAITLPFTPSAFTFGEAQLKEFRDGILPSTTSADLPALSQATAWLATKLIEINGRRKPKAYHRRAVTTTTQAISARVATITGRKPKASKSAKPKAETKASKAATPDEVGKFNTYVELGVAKLKKLQRRTNDPSKKLGQAAAMRYLTGIEDAVVLTVQEQAIIDMANAVGVDLAKLARI
jgi:hypothetical protein